jgi:hypothetical protein
MIGKLPAITQATEDTISNTQLRETVETFSHGNDIFMNTLTV